MDPPVTPSIQKELNWQKEWLWQQDQTINRLVPQWLQNEFSSPYQGPAKEEQRFDFVSAGGNRRPSQAWNSNNDVEPKSGMITWVGRQEGLFEYHKDKGNDFEHGSENVIETRFADLVDVSMGLISTGEVN
jgi:hypothetical protein